MASQWTIRRPCRCNSAAFACRTEQSPKCVGSPWLTDGPDEGWIIVDLDKDSPGHLERYHLERARTDLVLYVDGDIINMNNVQIPKDSPIIDSRFDND